MPSVVFWSRRRFLTSAATLALAPRRGLFFPFPAASAGTPGGRDDLSQTLGPCCRLLDGGGRTLLRESFQGFQSGLEALGVRAAVASVAEAARSPFAPPIEAPSTIGVAGRGASTLIIVPAALLEPRSAALLRRQVRSGATVVFESAAAFAERRQPPPCGSAPTSPAPEFRAQARLVRSAFGITLVAACRLWPRPSARPLSAAPPPGDRPSATLPRRPQDAAARPPLPPVRPFPYVRYGWPTRATVRDFSRAVTVADADAIAWVGGRPVAARKRLGGGTLIFLGSPLGPHLLSRDPDAARWLAAVVRSSAVAA